MIACSPATYARYSGSPAGSIYDMESTLDNFGLSRLPLKTPLRGLLVPKFSHGVLGSLAGGIQAADFLLGGTILRGFARLNS